MDNQQQDLSQQPTQPASTSSSFFKTLSIGIGIVGIGIVIGIGGYFLAAKNIKNKPAVQPSLSPAPGKDTTANWKTYASEKLSFKYPADKFTVEERAKGLLMVKPIGAISELNGISIDSRNSESYDLSLRDNLTRELANPRVEAVGNGVKISGTYSSSSQGSSLEGTEVIAGYLTGNGNLVVAQTTDKGSFAYFDQILSTFEFTDQNQTSVSSAQISQGEIDAIKKILLPIVKTTSDQLVFDINTDLTNQYNGLFALGNAGAKDAAGSGAWIAVKVNGVWKIASYGNGIAKCSDINPYNVPSVFVKMCTDKSGRVVSR